ncbi:aldose 1-epimerase [Algibacter sp. 2305UL17-15]|uniref:aldose 1-epimerase n=1 Tax=Algibacter sp. 2305UL17-15 TaxID=3231268 RepID=UPI00345929E7
MYTIKHHQDQNILEIKNSENSVYGKIHLDAGASLQELTIGGHAIIQDLSPLTYESTYASAILFPFANRIKDGTYEFNGKSYQLKKNQEEEQNALHGLVYNKTFKVIQQEATNSEAKVALEYIENNTSQGFPFTYKIKVDYTFKKNAVNLGVTITNTSTKPFPFTLGWHPYFISENLNESELNFDSHQKLVLGERNITTGIEAIENTGTLHLKDQQLDDCWILNSDKVTFKTPKYNLEFSTSGTNNYLQAYTPPKPNVIAIEPTTGVSDSFNNSIGLEILKANGSHTINWGLKITN